MLTNEQLKKVMVKSDEVFMKHCNDHKNCEDCEIKCNWCNIRWVSERIMCERFFVKNSENVECKNWHKQELKQLNKEMEGLLKYTGIEFGD